MAKKFTVIPKSTFDDMQLDAGVLVKRFDITNPTTPADEDIICATTGGINVSCVPTYSDFGEDVDNCPNNTKELKHLDSWECKIGFTSLGTTEEGIKLALGSADVNPTTHAITPRATISQDDFSDLWWVGDKADGGLVAVKVKNALSTSGFSLQTTKNGKGQLSVEMTGHVSINAQDEMPMEFYALDANEEVDPSVELNKHSAIIAEGDTLQLTANTTPESQTVTWTSSSGTVASVEAGLVTALDAGETIITATITVEGHTYNDTCTVIVTEVVQG